jgi:uncharacterized protein (DUF58 family)
MPPSDSTADVASALRIVSAPQVLRKLDRLRLVDQHSVTHRPGNTPVARATQASGLELANHKLYSPGDDLRHLDWNAYGRLDQRLIKTFRAEREAPVHLLIDASASMAVPSADGKLAFAAGLAAGLAYVAMRQSNPVRAVVLADGAASRISPLLRHVQRLPDLLHFLGRLEAHGSTRLGDGIEAYLRSTPLPGTAVLLSDFLVEPGIYQTALDRLRGRGYHVLALRIIGPHERDPSALPRQVRLRDAESGAERLVDLTAAHRARYARAVDDHLAQLRQWCAARAIGCAAADTSAGLEACLLAELPRAGLLQ